MLVGTDRLEDFIWGDDIEGTPRVAGTAPGMTAPSTETMRTVHLGGRLPLIVLPRARRVVFVPDRHLVALAVLRLD